MDAILDISYPIPYEGEEGLARFLGAAGWLRTAAILSGSPRAGQMQKGLETMSKMINMSLEEVHSTTRALLEKQGFDEAHAQSIANTVTAAERDECRHHGLFRIPFT